METSFFHLSGEGLPADISVVGYQAREGVSVPFEIEVDFSTQDEAFVVDACLRKPLLLTVVDAAGSQRVLHGVVDEAAFVQALEPHLSFRLRLRPALAALSHREGSRIYQNKSVQEIAQSIFTAAGFGDRVEWDLKGTYEPREYIVQYRETELDFVSRLFEDQGIFYFFKHTAEGHSMVVADHGGAFVLEEGAPAVQFFVTQGAFVGGQPLHEVSRTRSLRTASVLLRDYDFEKPDFAPSADKSAPEKWSHSFYEYPGGFTKADLGKQMAAARIQQQRHDADLMRGSSKAIGMRIGVPFEVHGAAEQALEGEFVVIALETRGTQHVAGGGGEENVACENRFTAIQKDQAWLPPRRTKKPRIRGVQTAVVTGQSGEDQSIHVDKYGRIKVRFYWDRIGQQDENSSCWIRVTQVGMGGTVNLPRVGWEVLVSFLDGDPDRPVALGCLYNGEKPVPHALPGARATGGLKSHSSPGGGGSNEFKMADDGGKQGMNLSAQKDLNISTGHDRNETVAVDETHNVKVNMTTSVGANETIQVGANQSVDVGANYTQNVTGAQSISIGGNDTTNATANMVENITGARSYTISGRSFTLQNGIRLESTGDFSRKVGAVQIVGAVGAISDNIAAAYTSNVGAVTLHLVNGTHGETVGGAKTQTSTAAELHLISGNFQSACSASVTTMVGGLHYQKIGGDLTIKAPMLTLLGGVGIFKGGGTTVKLGGGPIVMKGSKISFKTPMLVKMGSSLKMGS